jgi:hypothetical protein
MRRRHQVVVLRTPRGIDVRGSMEAGWKEMEKAGVVRAMSSDLQFG